MNHTLETGVGTRPPDERLLWPGDAPRKPWEARFKLALLLVLALLLLPLLGRVPRAFVDDSWSAPMSAYTLAFEGRSRNPGQMGRGGVDRYMIEPRLFPSVVGAIVYRLAGFGLTQGRVAAVIFAGVFVFAVYGLIRMLFGPIPAAAVALMTVMDPWVFICGRTFREEIFLAALLWLAWWLLLPSTGGGRPVRAFLGGVCLGLGCWTHPNVAVFGASSSAAFLAAVGLTRFVRSWLVVAAVGVVVGVSPYVGYVLYVQGVSDVRLLEQVAERSGAFLRPWDTMLAVEWERWVNFLRLPHRLPLAMLYVWAVVYAAWRGQRGDRLLLLLVIGSALLLPVLQNVRTGRYCVILVPALAALLWRSLPRSAHRGWGSIGPLLGRDRAARTCAWALLAVYVLMSFGPTLAVVYAHRGADYGRWVDEIGREIPHDATVMGNTVLWTGLHDRRFISSLAPSREGWADVDAAAAHIEQHRPDYLVQSSDGFSSVGGLGPRATDLSNSLFSRACERIVRRIPATMLKEMTHRDFGTVRVWKLEWASDSSRSRGGEFSSRP